MEKALPEYSIRLSVEALPEGQYLATSEDLPDLVAQGRTVAETMEIARDVARKLIDSYSEHGEALPSVLSDKSHESIAYSGRPVTGAPPVRT